MSTALLSVVIACTAFAALSGVTALLARCAGDMLDDNAQDYSRALFLQAVVPTLMPAAVGIGNISRGG